MRSSMLRRATWSVALAVLGLLLIGYAVVRVRSARGNELHVVIPVSAYRPGTVQFDRGVWIARQPSGEFYAFLNRDPHRGEPLNWVESERLFMQAASYGLDGMCQEGPCDPSPGQGLYRVESRPEGQNLIIYPQKVISGGFHPEPTWITDVKHFLSHYL